MEPATRFPGWEISLAFGEGQLTRVRALPSGWPDVVSSHEPVRPGGRVNLVRDGRG